MSIEIKISKKRFSYKKAMLFLDKRVDEVKLGKNKELIWILEHPTTFTAGVSFKNFYTFVYYIFFVISNSCSKGCRVF